MRQQKSNCKDCQTEYCEYVGIDAHLCDDYDKRIKLTKKKAKEEIVKSKKVSGKRVSKKGE